jgi:hypothetical protein
MRRSRLFRTLSARSTRWLPACTDVGELIPDGRGDATVPSGPTGVVANFLAEGRRVATLLDVRGRYTSSRDTDIAEVEVGSDPPRFIAARDGVCTALR